MELKEYQIKLNNGIYDKRNKVNNLTGKEWLFSTRSVKTKSYNYFISIYEFLKHGFIDFIPIDLAADLITTFSKNDSIVVDPICNFGTFGYAITNIEGNRKFIGFNYKNKLEIFLDKVFKKDKLVFYPNEFFIDPLLTNNSKKFLFSTELIFSSLDPHIRLKEYSEFEKRIEKFVKLIIKSNINYDYIIITIQNSKELVNNISVNRKVNYRNNADILNKFMTSNYFILKAELIWKIPEFEFSEMKNILLENNHINHELNLLLNDKRILIFKKD